MSFFSFFNSFKSLIKKALNSATTRGLTNEILAQAIASVKLASTEFTNNTERREWAVKFLISKGVSESIARLAVELAVQTVKDELDKLPNSYS